MSGGEWTSYLIGVLTLAGLLAVVAAFFWSKFGEQRRKLLAELVDTQDRKIKLLNETLAEERAQCREEMASFRAQVDLLKSQWLRDFVREVVAAVRAPTRHDDESEYR